MVITVILIIKLIMKQLFLDEWKKWSYIGYYIGIKQEGQHPLTGQRAPPISGGTYRQRRTLIDGYLESPFPTACLL